MAAANYLQSEDQFLCSICLDVFTDPITAPCGHNFCKTCITEHWNTSMRCLCPMCKHRFTTRPDLRVNTFVSEMVAQFRQSARQMHDVVPLTEEYDRKKAKVSVRPSSYKGTVVKAVKRAVARVVAQMKKLPESELKRVQQYAVDVTLDPDTAHPDLILSDDGKQVKDGDVRKNLPDNPERFYKCPCVLGKQSFSSGRFYFEVQVKGNTEWRLGVARESIDRKGSITLSREDGYWTIVLTNGNEYKALADPSVLLSLKSPPQKVGVFVDYEEGLVSFYDVDAAALIYSFTGCSFTEKLFPFFSPCYNDAGENSAPLIISPVRVN